MNYPNFLFRLYQLKKNLRKTPEQIQKLQKKKLDTLLLYAYKNSPYYKRIFAQAGITGSDIGNIPLSSFPSLNKTQLIANFDELVTVPGITQEALRVFDESQQGDRAPYKGKYRIVHSSGSTGKPAYFLYDRAAWNSMLVGITRAALWNMSMPSILSMLFHGVRIAYVAATEGRYGGAMAVGDGIDACGAKQIHLDINMPLAEWTAAINDFKPNMIIGYPSAVKIIAGLAEEGKIDLRLIRIVTCGEPLGASLRNYLETKLSAPVINFYGAGESLSLGVECSASEGMILFDDMNVIEVQHGCMYLTCLYNFAQPLIRYRLNDSLFIEAPGSSDRVPFSRAMGLLGRSEDLLWFENSSGFRDFLHPLAVEGICIEGLRDYQFYCTGKTSFAMTAEVSAGSDTVHIESQIRNCLQHILNEKNLPYVHFEIQFTEKIEADSVTGKKRLIIEKSAQKNYRTGAESA